MKKHVKFAITIISSFVIPGYVLAQDNQIVGTDFAVTSDNMPSRPTNYSPYVGKDHTDRVYWGDSHLHTSYAWDAGFVGNTLGPDDAYRFAK
ncbi:MAG: DUF3604 domain-containing protein [Arenicellales bacterium]